MYVRKSNATVCGVWTREASATNKEKFTSEYWMGGCLMKKSYKVNAVYLSQPELLEVTRSSWSPISFLSFAIRNVISFKSIIDFKLLFFLTVYLWQSYCFLIDTFWIHFFFTTINFDGINRCSNFFAIKLILEYKVFSNWFDACA